MNEINVRLSAIDEAIEKMRSLETEIADIQIKPSEYTGKGSFNEALEGTDLALSDLKELLLEIVGRSIGLLTVTRAEFAEADETAGAGYRADETAGSGHRSGESASSSFRTKVPDGARQRREEK